MSRLLRAASLLFALAVTASAALAQAPMPRLALEIQPGRTLLRRDDPVATSVARRVATHLVPLLESRGWHVIRVDDASDAAKGKHDRYHAAARLFVDAETTYWAPEALLYQNDTTGKEVVANVSESAEAWGSFRVHDGLTGKVLVYGELPRIVPQVRNEGSTTSLDDEEAVARLLADSALAALAQGLDLTMAGRP